MVIKLADIQLDPPVFLAPQAGITDLPFRNLVAGFGAGLVVSEMVASQEMVQARALAQARAELGLEVARGAGVPAVATAVQIAGREAYWMAECARLCVDHGARLIDINMGCPARKVTNGYSGSALMRDLDHALRLIEAVVAAVPVPVSLKMRLGWDGATLNAAELGRRAADAGVRMVTVHGRTRCQFYKGQADWRAIGAVKRSLDVPVIANGDIVDAASAAAALKLSRADGGMIGRGAQGAPWRLAQVAAALFGAPDVIVPEGAALADVVESHYEAMLSFYGTRLGGKVARKHLGWYMDGLETPPDIRRAVLTASAPATVRRLIRSLCRNTVRARAA